MVSVPIKVFARKLQTYYPFCSYRKALRWANTNKLPIWPRLGNEPINVRIEELRPFCLELGLSAAETEKFITDLCT